MPTIDLSKADQLYLKGLKIREGEALGLWLPIMQHLALRRHTGAMIEVASWYTETNRLEDYGSAADSFSPGGLYRRAYRKGDANAAQHLAMGCFNRRDLRGYRLWLRRAATAGDADAAYELRLFETRLSHTEAHKIGRGRPLRKWEKI